MGEIARVHKSTPARKAAKKVPAKKAAAKKAAPRKAPAKKAAAKKAPAKKTAAKKVPAKKAPAKKTAAKKAAPKKASRSSARTGGSSTKTASSAQAMRALPAPPEDPRLILGLGTAFTKTDLRRRWRAYAAVHHPDGGGDAATFARGQQAYETLLGQLG